MHTTYSSREKPRPATPEELRNVIWLHNLQPHEQSRVKDTLMAGSVDAGALLCRAGKAPSYWFGLLSGLLKMTNDDSISGHTMTFSGVAPGGWFGEGTLLKHEPYRYNIQALRKSKVALLPVATFEWLLENSIGFNRFLMQQLNERLGQFIAAREIERLSNPDLRVARSLAALFNPVLFPVDDDSTLQITQQELGYLVGLSRQRVNEALKVLEQHGAIKVVYGGLLVRNLDMLRGGMFGVEDV